MQDFVHQQYRNPTFYYLGINPRTLESPWEDFGRGSTVHEVLLVI